MCPLHECMRVGVCIHFCKTANKDLHANKRTHGEMCNNEYTGKHEVSELTTVSLLTQHTHVENTDYPLVRCTTKRRLWAIKHCSTWRQEHGV